MDKHLVDVVNQSNYLHEDEVIITVEMERYDQEKCAMMEIR
jgi:hypothetical protein